MNIENYENLSGVWTHSTSKTVVRGEGCYLYTEDGDKILDFTSGIGVNSTGHCHSNVVKAVAKQAETLLFSQVNCALHNKIFELTEELKTVVPPELTRFFYAQSGAEAVEAAVKLAKHATGRPNIIVLHGSFHGRTHMAMAMTTSKTIYRKSYPNLPSGVFIAPYPYAFATGRTEEEETDYALRSLETVLETQTDPGDCAAIFVEPVLGEGGYIPGSKGYLEGVRKICDKHGILMVADEIQSGFGRTGKMFGFQWSSIIPDIITMAKGLASGIPMSAIAYREELDKKWQKGTHGGTYGGSPIGCAAAISTIETIKSEKLVENADKMGKVLMEGLYRLQKQYPVIGDIRGYGLMIGIELMDGKNPLTELPKKIITKAYDKGLMLLSCGLRKNVIRLIPPLIVNKEEVNIALDIIESVLEDIYGN